MSRRYSALGQVRVDGIIRLYLTHFHERHMNTAETNRSNVAEINS
jgi:hypothetical protein